MKFRMIRFCTILVTALATPSSYAEEDSRTLSFFHTHTGKSLEVTYWCRGEYREEAFGQLREILADWRNGEQADIDPGLLDLLYRIRQATGSTAPCATCSTASRRATIVSTAFFPSASINAGAAKPCGRSRPAPATSCSIWPAAQGIFWRFTRGWERARSASTFPRACFVSRAVEACRGRFSRVTHPAFPWPTVR